MTCGDHREIQVIMASLQATAAATILYAPCATQHLESLTIDASDVCICGKKSIAYRQSRRRILVT